MPNGWTALLALRYPAMHALVVELHAERPNHRNVLQAHGNVLKIASDYLGPNHVQYACHSKQSSV